MINRNNKIGLIGFLGVLLLVTVSCNLAAKKEKEEREEIAYYLNSNPLLLFQQKPSGLYYLDVVIGTGAAPATNDSVFVLYTCKDLYGIIYGSNIAAHALTGEYYSFKANNGENVVGFDEAIMLMKKGGKSMILVPSYIGYGAAGTDYIPGYEPLLFDIELVNIKPASGK
jgi:FKBP-type peptidyl-prolyl cis-trans isomerase FkpA